MSKSNLNDTPEFGKIRQVLWPIHAHEMKKFLPMGAMMFFILFNYTILRDTKDSLVITASANGSAVIPFLKIGCVLPASILFVVMYAKMANILSREKLFYTLVSSFIVYFLVFAFVLYPNKALFHPSSATIQYLKSTFPHFQHIFPLWGTWMYTLFYVMSELWGSVMISLLFWQFANEITRTNEAKRFYGLFGLLANVSLICSGFTVRFLSVYNCTRHHAWLLVRCVLAMAVGCARTRHALLTHTCTRPRDCIVPSSTSHCPARTHIATAS